MLILNGQLICSYMCFDSWSLTRKESVRVMIRWEHVKWEVEKPLNYLERSDLYNESLYVFIESTQYRTCLCGRQYGIQGSP